MSCFSNITLVGDVLVVGRDSFATEIQVKV